ncbi:MAG: hypothetical protein Q8O12_02440 [Candidatus Omnitrophota bacterium]|nr:hypothetical protein [Candidatus Omnitrophota bacterium]
MRIIIIAVVALLVSASLGYCQELSDKELGIYYGAVWETLQAEYELGADPTEEDGQRATARIQRFMNQNNVTENELQGIVERGNNMTFTSAEENLAEDMDAEITDYLTSDQMMSKLRELGDRYGMSMGQVSSVFTRKIARD